MEPTIHRLICRDIGGDHQRVDSQRTRYSAVTFKPLLLPVWVAAYRYREKTYQIVVNGRTGRVAGDRPWSGWKIAGQVALLVAVFAVIAYLVVRFNG